MAETGVTMRGARRPLVIADGGASAEAPEHTIAAFERAVDQGADRLWLDVHCARDHHPVIIRDFTLERTTSGAGPVVEHDVRALKRLDAGRWWGPAFAGQRIQTLEEALERFRDRVGFVLALRGGLACYPELAERVVALVDIYEVTARSVLMSHDLPALWAARELNGDLAIGALRPPGPPGEVPPGILAMGVEAGDLTAPAVASLQADRIDCYALGVGEPDDGVRLATWGVAGIVTGRPGSIRTRLGR